MQTKKKKVLLVSAGLSLAVFGLAISFAANSSDSFRAKANGVEYSVNFSGSNGQATVATKKTTISGAKTAKNNDVSVEYKNMTPVSGKVGKLNASVNGFKAYYGNATPINGMSSITVSSDAVAGDAVVKYGRTSACLDGEFDLAVGSVDGIYAHYFKIVADKEVTINSVNIELACDNGDNGFEAFNGESDISSSFIFLEESGIDGYTIKSPSSTMSRVIVPDFYGSDSTPVKKIMGKTTSYGFFENASSLTAAYIPETISEFGNWFFSGKVNSLTSFTYPRDLEKISSNATSGRIVPDSTGLTTVYYNSKNFDYRGSAGFNSSYQSALERVYVSADVETLPNSMVSSFRDGVSIFYEGTEAEWAALTASASNWNTATTIICSDTVLADITLSFNNAVLGDFENSKTITSKVGAYLDNPGSPISNDGNKKFDGWYTEPDGAGVKVSFPYEVTATATIYANFIDVPAGYELDNPVDAVLDGVYSFSTDSTHRFAYVRYTAVSDVVVMVTPTNWSASGDCTYKVYNADGEEVSITTGNSGETDVKVGPTSPSTNSGANIPVKVRMSAGDVFTFRFGNASYDATFDVTVREPVANEDYTTATPIVFGEDINYTVNNYGVRWAYIDLDAGDYLFNFKASAWAGIHIGTINNNVFTDLTGSSLNAPGTAGIDGALNVPSAGRYYVAMTTNTTGTVVTAKAYNEVPATYAKGTAEVLTVGGDSATVTYTKEIQPKWYKFTAATAGRYVITSDKTLTAATGSNSWKSSTRYVGIYSYSGDVETRHVLAKNGNYQLYADLEAGEYYIKAASYSGSSNDYTLGVSVINKVTLTYNTHGGSAIDAVEVYPGFSITKPGDPTKANHRFDGWYVDSVYSEEFSFTSGISEDTTIHAKWVRQYTVTIHANNGSEATTDLADEGVPYAPATPSYEYHGFLGWYYDSTLETPFDPAALVSGDFDIYADWKAQHYSNEAATFIEENVANSGDYLYAFDDTPAGIVSTGDYQFTTFESSDYSGSIPGIKSTNKDKHSTTCLITLNFENAGLFSFDYAVSSEGEKWDYFRVAVDGVKAFDDKGGKTLIEASSGDIRVEAGQSLTMQYTKDSSQSGGIDEVYIWNMEFKPAPKILTGITLNTSGVKTVFEKGEEFSYAGLVVTANYSDETSAIVTPTEVIAPNMNIDAKQTVTVKYTEDEVEKTASYEVTVGSPSLYTNTAAVYLDKLPNSSSCLAPYNEDASAAGIVCGSYTFAKFSGKTLDGEARTGIKAVGSDGCTAYIELKFVAACTFRFTYKISSESGYDFGYVKKNDSTVVSASGSAAGVQKDIEVEANDVIRFEYKKDSSMYEYDDTIYIYGIQFIVA